MSGPGRWGIALRLAPRPRGLCCVARSRASGWRFYTVIGARAVKGLWLLCSPVMLEAVGDVDNELVAPVCFDQGTGQGPVHDQDLSLEAIGGEGCILRD